MKKRWLSLLVENEIGVLARISGLFSAKLYNLNSLTVGATEDESASRITISLTSDEKTFEQVKKQLNRCVEVIKVIDLSDKVIHNKELLFIKIRDCGEVELNELFRIAKVFSLTVYDYNFSSVILECVHSEDNNNSIIEFLNKRFSGKMEVVRGGSVAIESISNHVYEDF